GNQQHLAAAECGVVGLAREDQNGDLVDVFGHVESRKQAGNELAARIKFAAETALARLPALRVQRWLDVRKMACRRVECNHIELDFVPASRASADRNIAPHEINAVLVPVTY